MRVKLFAVHTRIPLRSSALKRSELTLDLLGLFVGLADCKVVGQLRRVASMSLEQFIRGMRLLFLFRSHYRLLDFAAKCGLHAQRRCLHVVQTVFRAAQIAGQISFALFVRRVYFDYLSLACVERIRFCEGCTFSHDFLVNAVFAFFFAQCQALKQSLLGLCHLAYLLRGNNDRFGAPTDPNNLEVHGRRPLRFDCGA